MFLPSSSSRGSNRIDRILASTGSSHPGCAAISRLRHTIQTEVERFARFWLTLLIISVWIGQLAVTMALALISSETGLCQASPGVMEQAMTPGHVTFSASRQVAVMEWVLA